MKGKTMQELAETYLDSKLAEGYQLRSGYRRTRAVNTIAREFQADLDARISYAVAEATDKAIRDWDSSEAEINPNAVLWESGEADTEAEYDAKRETERLAAEAEAAARRFAEVAALHRAMVMIPAVMHAGTHYRYNAPIIEAAESDPSIRARAIVSLVANGTLVKIERTSDNPPFLMLVEEY